jgi:50S ribosomal protein L16 3-hydroxylase
LGGLAVPTFLRRHWHKMPLLVRNAIEGFAGPFTAGRLFSLSGRDDVESRLVVRDGARWSLAHGPFRRADFAALPPRNWTLLVQGVNLVEPAGDALLRRFSFLPFARLDDLMVSYAAPGGGVGPHVDSYDVFLLQGFGRRRWRYGVQDDVALKRGLPLKILRRFSPDSDATLAPGDMLYLPPSVAHDGVAIDACTTYSIGFRAPSATELTAAFLDFLRDELDPPGRYADPDPGPVRAPAAISAPMRRRYLRLLKGVSWDDATAARFVGAHLVRTESARFFRAAEVAACASGVCESRRKARTRARPSHATPLRRSASVHQRHQHNVAGERRRVPAPACQRPRAGAFGRQAPVAGDRRDPLQLVPRWVPPHRPRLTATRTVRRHATRRSRPLPNRSPRSTR